MSESPSWMRNFDGRPKPRSQSLQPGSGAFWDARKTPQQPLKWQPEYNQRSSSGSPYPPSPGGPGQGQGPRQLPHSSSKSSLLSRMNSGSNLDTIPEDHFLDRGTDFRFVGGIRNPVFEMSDLSNRGQGQSHGQSPYQGQGQGRSSGRRHSEGDVLDRGFTPAFNRSESSPYRQSLPRQSENRDNRAPTDTSNNERSKERRKSVYSARSDLRSDTKSDVSVGGRSVISAKSESGLSDKSEDKLTSVNASRTDRRRSETPSKSNERRPSAAPSRRSEPSITSSISNTNTKKAEPSVITTSPIEIPVEFLETPASRIKKLFGPVIMCVLVVTLAGSLGAAIYFATVLKEAQEQTIDLLKAQLEMSTSGVDVQALSLRRRDSLIEDYCLQIDEFYQASSLFERTYKRCEVNLLTNSKIKFTLYFDDNENIATTDNIVDVLKARATEGVNSKQVEVSRLKLDLETVKVTLEKPITPTTLATSTETIIAATPPTSDHYPDGRPLTREARLTTTTPRMSNIDKENTQQRQNSMTTRSTDSVVQEPDICEGKSGDYFPHARECNLYVQCHDGGSVTFACPQSTVFDINKKVCVTRTDDVICPEKPMTAAYDWSARDPWDPCRDVNDEQYFPYPEDCNLYFQCQHNKSIVRLCPKNSIFDMVKQICMPPSPDVICHTITTPTTVTDPNIDPALTQTGSTTSAPPIEYPRRPDYSATPCKDGVNGGLYPDPANCSKYILCEYENERTQSCADGLYFDPDINTCIEPRNDLLCPDIRPCKGVANGSRSPFPHPLVCKKFIMCRDGQEVIRSCMHDTVWNPRVNTCVPKTDNVTCPDGST